MASHIVLSPPFDLEVQHERKVASTRSATAELATDRLDGGEASRPVACNGSAPLSIVRADCSIMGDGIGELTVAPLIFSAKENGREGTTGEVQQPRLPWGARCRRRRPHDALHL
ncbi:hypothetical protein TIFTF001_046157, partial [Ficus carica]